MPDLVVRGALVLLLLALIGVVKAARDRRRALSRLFSGEAEVAQAKQVQEEEAEDLPPPASILGEWAFVPWLALVGIGLGLHYSAGLGAGFALAFAVMGGVLTEIGRGFIRGRRIARLEEGLADAIDVMVGALRAGLGTMEATLEAAKEARGELKGELESVIGRIRFGSDPRQAYLDLAHRIPLETFELFSTALAIHAETGGSLARTLATVAAAIRDRVEVSRQVRTESTQARVSMIVILGCSYFIALIAWRSNPFRMEQFLRSTFGSGLAAGAMVIQAFGVYWLYRMSQVRL